MPPFLAYEDAWLKRERGQGRRSRRISGSKRSGEALTASGVKGSGGERRFGNIWRKLSVEGHVGECGLFAKLNIPSANALRCQCSRT
jgi:hypothetical protein